MKSITFNEIKAERESCKLKQQELRDKLLTFVNPYPYIRLDDSENIVVYNKDVAMVFSIKEIEQLRDALINLFPIK